MSAQNRANQANEARYQQAMGELQGLRRQTMADIGSTGESARKEILERSRADLAAIRQEMTQRGLAHSTVLPAVLAGAARQRNRDLIALSNSMAEQRANARMATTDRIVSHIGSKNEAGPPPRMAASLAQGVGDGGGGMYGFGNPYMMMQQQMMQQQQMNPQMAWQAHLARLRGLQASPMNNIPMRQQGFQGPPGGVLPPMRQGPRLNTEINRMNPLLSPVPVHNPRMWQQQWNPWRARAYGLSRIS